MGLFSKKQREPRVHPVVSRTIEVPASMADVVDQLQSYSGLHSPKHGAEIVVRMAEAAGCTHIELPDRLHPWTFHNIGFWLLDTPNVTDGTVLRSSADGAKPGYALVRDPEMGDCLCGVDDGGVGMTVHVPSNEITRGETVPAVAPAPTMNQPSEWSDVAILVEDPAHDMNPDNDITAKSRSRLIPRYMTF